MATEEYVFECTECEARLRVSDRSSREYAREQAQEDGWEFNSGSPYCPLHK